jgi:hypothetical protein
LVQFIVALFKKRVKGNDASNTALHVSYQVIGYISLTLMQFDYNGISSRNGSPPICPMAIPIHFPGLQKSDAVDDKSPS